MYIVINGIKHILNKKKTVISMEMFYEDIVTLAYPNNKNFDLFDVSYQSLFTKDSGTINRNDSLDVEDGMIFNIKMK